MTFLIFYTIKKIDLVFSEFVLLCPQWNVLIDTPFIISSYYLTMQIIIPNIGE